MHIDIFSLVGHDFINNDSNFILKLFRVCSLALLCHDFNVVKILLFFHVIAIIAYEHICGGCYFWSDFEIF